jgi:hypothetical protein
LIAVIVIYLRQREQRHLDYQFISINALLQEGASGTGVKVLYDNISISDPYLIIMRIINTGNKPITPDDFKTPVKVQFADSCKVVFAEVVESKPPDLAPELVVGDHDAQLKSSLFNPGDWVSVKLVVDGYPEERTVTGRVVGVRELRQYHPREISPLITSGLGLLLGLSTSVGVNILTGGPLTDFTRRILYLLVGLTVVALGGIVWILLMRRSQK